MENWRDTEDDDPRDDVFDDDDEDEKVGEGGTGGVGNFEIPSAAFESDDRGALFRANRGIKVWIMVAGIFVVLAIGVLYIYQAGDTRTVLGNQPIPAGQILAVANPAPQNVPALGSTAAEPTQPLLVPSAPPAIPQPSAAPAEADGPIRCPRCHTVGLAVCASCGAAMQPMNDNSGLHVCPSCGTVGIPICPRCGAHMVVAGPAAEQWPPAEPQAPATVGQFQCPACGAAGLPNRNTAGVPLCPRCGGKMTVQ